MRVLPSVTAIDPQVDALIAAGAVVRLDILADEIKEYKPEIVIIDDNTAIVDQTNRKTSKTEDSKGRGGYHLGISQTLCQKMKRDPAQLNTASIYEDKLEAMGVYIGNVSELIQRRLQKGKSGILEGTQGALLSLNSSYYPYVTSYDVTIPGVMSQAGIGYKDVGMTYGIAKAYPTRVSGNSGILGSEEITFESLGKSMQYQSAEDGSHDGEERLFEWSWSDFETAYRMNTPDRIIFTFADWLNTTGELDKMVDRIETYGARVSHIRYGENVRDYINRADNRVSFLVC